MGNRSWQRVEELFHRAMEVEPARRQAFLVEASADDRVLLKDVESLLAYEESARDFIEEQASAARQLLAEFDPEAVRVGEGSEACDNEPSSFDRLIGQTVSRFRIIERLGSGGMGVVYKAEDLRLGRLVALKFLLTHPSPHTSGGTLPTQNEDSVVAQLYREARACSALDHPNICTIYEVDQHEGFPFIVMQLLVGRSLKEEIGGRPLSIGRLLDFGIQIADALEAAHSAGIIHRDIKPANIFITQRGEAKILDFGVAKLANPASTDADVQGGPAPLRLACGDALDATIMRTGMALGTVAYMSPEQILGKRLTASTDIFSLGVVLYEMATGVQPFSGDDAAAVFSEILQQSPPPPVELHPSLPERLEHIMLQALEKDPDKRYPSISALRDDLMKARAAIRPARDANAASRSSPRSRWILMSVAVMLAIACGGGYLLYRHFGVPQSPALWSRDTIVLADIDNNTGESVFDETLNQALRVQLEQSPFLNVLSPQVAAEEQQYMGRKLEDYLPSGVALTICQRTGSKAMLSGAIGALGSHYLLTLRVVNCRNGDTLDTEEEEVHGREAVLSALGKAAHKLRARLGESLASVQRYDAPVEEATTPSLEALRAYGLGLKIWYAEGEKASIPYFEKATEIDPRFAMAHARLGNAYFETNQLARGRDAVRTAYKLRDRVSERERLYIDSHYYENVSGELDKAVQVFKLWQETYPDDPIPYVNLGADYTTLGQYEQALAQDRKALQLEPTLGLLYSNLALGYANLEDFDNAEKILHQAQEKHLQYATLIGASYQLAFLRGNKDAMAREVQRGIGQPWTEGWLLAMQADTEAYYGHERRASQFTERAIESAHRYDDQEISTGYLLMDALRQAEYGFGARAKKEALRALARDDGQQTQVLAALVLARVGESGRALEIAHELYKQFPTDTMLNRYWLPTIHAAAALSGNNPSDALSLLQDCSPYELATPKTPTTAALYPVYLRGLTFLSLGDGRNAETEFQKIIHHKGIAQNYLLGALAHLGLARSYARMAASHSSIDAVAQSIRNDPNGALRSEYLAKAVASYQSFFTLWAEATPSIPIYRKAKIEYQNLPADRDSRRLSAR